MLAASIFVHFFILCAFAVGGLNTVMPGLFHYVVDEQGWLGAREFTDLYAIGQAAPGPNALWVTLIGLRVASWPGALAATAAMLLPGVLFSLLLIGLQARNPSAPFAVAFRRGLAPIAIGLMFSSGWVLLRSIGHDWAGLAITLATAAAILRTRLNPLLLLAAGAAAGALGAV
ncbi:MAG TPA: chromate transporter [Burkholderiales bacterium]